MPLETCDWSSFFAVIETPMGIEDLPADERHCTICQTPYIEIRDMPFIHSNESQFCYLPVKIPCGHVFGRRCIEKWLETPAARRTCPCCRADPSDSLRDLDCAYDADDEDDGDSDDNTNGGTDNHTHKEPSTKSKGGAASLASKR